ncbi:hypothetical protein NW752_006534 [Fusarium irregulare]|uniref:Uncharacterized protein n=1 Tax=Fusarium irregulare TaxID=2494466 RepID=A0A9W8PSC3_9HYPO|nr:hypothetical protein NW766_005409 [Fusarium irregulare]KAJ4015613.1 hypothetical protein NW752_006534 [Fusarium irregulare]
MTEPKDKTELGEMVEFKGMAKSKGRSYTVISSKQLNRARRWYYVQSRILGIPDRWGLISTGPPPRQVFEVREASRLMSMFCASKAFMTVVLYETLKEGGGFEWPYVWMSLSIELMVLLTFLVLLFRGPRNNPNFDWGTWEMDDERNRMGWLTAVMSFLKYL